MSAHYPDTDDENGPFRRRDYVALWWWRTLRKPFLRTRTYTRTELWLVRRAVAAQRRLFGWD